MLTIKNGTIESGCTIKPFLRWAGGKKWLVNYLDKFLPKNGFNNYHEPFLGGGSIFLTIKPSREAFLSDLNAELIDTFICVRDNPDRLIKILETFRNTEKYYYEIRAKHYDDLYQQAARFIYLNQISFNGIYRVNLQGKYNVPYGYRAKHFLDPDNLRNYSHVLKKAELQSGEKGK